MDTLNGQTPLTPLAVTNTATGWTTCTPLAMKTAALWNRLAPRGKGAVPRWIGRTFGRHWKTVIETDSGCRLAVDPGSLDLFVSIQNQGAWEPWITAACIDAMRDGDVMFDVGANAGAISNEVGRARPNSVIRSFEPQPTLAALIGISAVLNELRDIEVFQVAVGECRGTVELYMPAHALHASTLASGNQNVQLIDCEMFSLDEIVYLHDVPSPDLIKIDVEGGELNVLKGAQRLISENQPVIIFEVNDNCDRFGYSRDDLFRVIAANAGYRFYRVAPGDVLAAPEIRAFEFQSKYESIGWELP